MTATADVLDEHGDRASVCETVFVQFGRVRAFEGVISTVRCYEDNVLLRRRLSEGAQGGVLVVDGAGSHRVALVGEKIASLARDNGWVGLVMNACVRDVAVLADLELGIKAIGSTPRPSEKHGAGEIDVPVTFGGVTFRPGDMVFSDDDGVVTLGSAG